MTGIGLPPAAAKPGLYAEKKPRHPVSPRAPFNAISIDLPGINVMPGGRFGVDPEQAALLAMLCLYLDRDWEVGCGKGQTVIFNHGSRYVGRSQDYVDDIRKAWKGSVLERKIVTTYDDLHLNWTIRDSIGQPSSEVIANIEDAYPQANLVIFDANAITLHNGEKHPRWVKVPEDRGLTIRNIRTAVNRLGGHWQTLDAWHRKGEPLKVEALRR